MPRKSVETTSPDAGFDHEHVTELSSGDEVFSIAIYEVADDLIQKVWFIK